MLYPLSYVSFLHFTVDGLTLRYRFLYVPDVCTRQLHWNQNAGSPELTPSLHVHRLLQPHWLDWLRAHSQKRLWCEC